MQFVVSGAHVDQQPAGCVVVGVFEGGKLTPSALALDATSGGALSATVARGDADGELGTVLLINKIGNVASDRVLLVGLGPEHEFVERCPAR
jgi:leucyl aminopeptidase